MPSPSDTLNGDNLPPPAQRRVVLMGLATPAKGLQLSYNWEKIYDLWIVRPESSLLHFAQWLEIPYSSFKKRPEFSVEEKAAIIAAAATTWRDTMVQNLAVRSFGDPEAASVSMSQAIRDMQETTAIAAAYARGRMVKIDAQGRPVANAMLPPGEVDRLMGIISKCSNTIRNLVEVGRAVMSAREDLAVEPVPAKRVAE